CILYLLHFHNDNMTVSNIFKRIPQSKENIEIKVQKLNEMFESLRISPAIPCVQSLVRSLFKKLQFLEQFLRAGDVVGGSQVSLSANRSAFDHGRLQSNRQFAIVRFKSRFSSGLQ